MIIEAVINNKPPSLLPDLEVLSEIHFHQLELA